MMCWPFRFILIELNMDVREDRAFDEDEEINEPVWIVAIFAIRMEFGGNRCPWPMP